ncbi:MAG: hypothetical protein JXR97_12975 [Planctomycetes bacterium]|nr:hypothetical protein [Planctomycetota bacterium]
MIRVCCVCKRVFRAGGWIEEDLPENELPSHGYCPDCAAMARVELELFRLKLLCEDSGLSGNAVA